MGEIHQVTLKRDERTKYGISSGDRISFNVSSNGLVRVSKASVDSKGFKLNSMNQIRIPDILVRLFDVSSRETFGIIDENNALFLVLIRRSTREVTKATIEDMSLLINDEETAATGEVLINSSPRGKNFRPIDTGKIEQGQIDGIEANDTEKIVQSNVYENIDTLTILRSQNASRASLRYKVLCKNKATRVKQILNISSRMNLYDIRKQLEEKYWDEEIIYISPIN